MSPSSPLQIFNETELQLPFQKEVADHLLHLIAVGEQVTFDLVELVYVDEEGIISINKEYLNRDYVTDIISFRYDEDDEDTGIEGTLYCCAPRINEQAVEFNSTPEKEFLRIYTHGLLHLTGYDDLSDSEKRTMTELEDHYLGLAGIH